MDCGRDILCERLDPSSGLSISMALFRNVKNCKVLKEKVMSGTLQCVIIKPSLIVHPFQVIIAANKAAISNLSGTLITKNMYTELLFNLSISKNISQSLMKFGVHEKDEDILVATIDSGCDSSISDVIPQIDGDLVPMGQLNNVSDTKLICKSYKIYAEEMRVLPLLESVVSRIATSDFVSH